MRLSAILLIAAVLGFGQSTVPTDAGGWISLGIEASRSAQYFLAAMFFRGAAELEPLNISAHEYAGTAYMNLYVPGVDSTENKAFAEQARVEFQRVLELSPNHKGALLSLASLSYQEAQGLPVREEKFRKLDESVDWNRKLIAVDPQAKEAYYTLAVIAWLKWYPAYMEERERLGMRPEDPGPIADLNTRTLLNIEYGQSLADAIANLQKAIDIDPQYDDAMAYMNLIVRQRADLLDSKDDYEREFAAANEWVQKSLDTKRMKARSFELRQQSRTDANATESQQPQPTAYRFSGHIEQAVLIRMVDPIYPPLAKVARVQGTVRFKAVIGEDGHVGNLQVISGHPLLISAAIVAVEQWVYKPTLANGRPVAVETQVDVSFTLPPDSEHP